MDPAQIMAIAAVVETRIAYRAYSLKLFEDQPTTRAWRFSALEISAAAALFAATASTGSAPRLPRLF